MLEAYRQPWARRRSDLPLWGVALAVSLLVNGAAFTAIGLVALRPVTRHHPVDPASTAATENVATIFPELIEERPQPDGEEAAPEPAAVRQRFARTSDDQIAPPDGPAAFIGERNTRATSDRPPVPGAPALPSQAGIEPRFPGELETTESDYQDGELDAPAATAEAPTQEPPVAVASPPAVPPMPAAPGTAAAPLSPPAPRETLFVGPDPVDVEVPRQTAEGEDPKPTPPAETPPEPVMPQETPKEPSTEPPAESPGETPRETPPAPARPTSPSVPAAPAFKGFQRKTAVVGSISRSGRSALHVADTPLGRYQAAVGRAVEQEWQRACVRRRDFITPGFLTVRFFVEPSGKVRSVQALDDMKTGEIQKGFTLESIRKADIPAMPPALRGDYDAEPLELEFRFYF